MPAHQPPPTASVGGLDPAEVAELEALMGRVHALADIPAGPPLAAALAGLDEDRLPGLALTYVMQARLRQANCERGELLATIGRVLLHEVPGGATIARGPDEFAADEVRAGLALTRGAATKLCDLVWDLHDRLPGVLAAMRAGWLDQPRAQVFSTWTAGLSRQHTAAIVVGLLPVAAEMTTGELIDAIAKQAIALDPEWTRRRYERALQGRRVVGRRNPDGTGTLTGHDLPAGEVATACAHLDALAAAAKTAGHPDRLDHLRADLLVGLLTGRYTGLTDQQILTTLLATAPTTPHNNTDHDGSDHDGPDDEGLDDHGPDHDGPDDDGPDGHGPDDHGPDNGPDHNGPGHDGPDDGPDGHGPDDHGPDNGPDHNRPGHDGPDDGPDGHGPDSRGPGDHGPDSRGPGDHGPDSCGADDDGPDSRGPGDHGADSCGAGDDGPDGDGPGGVGRDAEGADGDVPGGGPAGRCGRGFGRRGGLRLWAGLPTLMGADQRPGELLGWGPVHAELAGDLARSLRSWWCVLTDPHGAPQAIVPIRRRPTTVAEVRRAGEVWLQVDPDTLRFLGALDRAGLVEPGWSRILAEITAGLDTAATGPPNGDPTARLPGAALRRWINIRDRRCTFPGCRAPAHRADTDHSVEHARGGATVDTGLSPACRHDHRLRHESRWRVEHTAPGHLTWTSPLGRTYQRRPPPGLLDLPEPRPGAIDERDPHPYPEDPPPDSDPDHCLQPEPPPESRHPPPIREPVLVPPPSDSDEIPPF